MRRNHLWVAVSLVGVAALAFLVGRASATADWDSKDETVIGMFDLYLEQATQQILRTNEDPGCHQWNLMVTAHEREESAFNFYVVVTEPYGRAQKERFNRVANALDAMKERVEGYREECKKKQH